LPLPRQHRDRGRGPPRAPLAGHGALRRGELARHQLRGARGVRRLRRAALVAAGAALILVAALAALAYFASRHSDRLLAEVGKGLGRDLRAERVGFTIRGGAGVTLAGVSIAEEPGLDTKEPFLTAREIELRLRLLPLVRRRLVVDRVLVEEPVVNLVRTESGAMNVDSLGKRAAPSQPHASPPVLDVESATLETLGGTVEGTAHLTSEGKGAGLTAQLDARGLELAELPAPKGRPRPSGTLELHGTLAGPPPEAPTFTSGASGQGRFAVTDGRIEGAGFGRPLLDALQAFLKPGV